MTFSFLNLANTWSELRHRKLECTEGADRNETGSQWLASAIRLWHTCTFLVFLLWRSMHSLVLLSLTTSEALLTILFNFYVEDDSIRFLTDCHGKCFLSSSGRWLKDKCTVSCAVYSLHIVSSQGITRRQREAYKTLDNEGAAPALRTADTDLSLPPPMNAHAAH